jgi:DNA adenine methylase
VTRPFLRWVGGKAQLVPELRALLPAGWRSLRYVAPFVGGGALFFALQAELERGALLADANQDLVHAYQVVQGDVGRLVSRLGGLSADAATFDRLKSQLNGRRHRAPLKRAAALIAVNRMAFNGLYRLNGEGELNVAFDPSREDCDLVREARLLAASATLLGAEVRCQDFRETLAEVGEGDLVYADSPYVPRVVTDSRQLGIVPDERPSFTAYTARGFSQADHLALLEGLVQARDRGAFVLASNAANPAWEALYLRAGFELHRVRVRRDVSCDAATRGLAQEVVYTGRPS